MRSFGDGWLWSVTGFCGRNWTKCSVSQGDEVLVTLKKSSRNVRNYERCWMEWDGLNVVAAFSTMGKIGCRLNNQRQHRSPLRIRWRSISLVSSSVRSVKYLNEVITLVDERIFFTALGCQRFFRQRISAAPSCCASLIHARHSTALPVLVDTNDVWPYINSTCN
jgi:hypothetical protein